MSALRSLPSCATPLFGRDVYDYYPHLHADVCKWLSGRCPSGQNVEDFAAEGCFRVFQYLHERVTAGAVFPTPEALRNFLSAVAKNIGLALRSKFWRGRDRFVELDDITASVLTDSAPSADNLLAMREVVDELQRAKLELSHANQVVLDHLEDGLSPGEIATIHGETDGGGRMRVRACRLREQLRERVPDVNDVLPRSAHRPKPIRRDE